ncbi:uncharacterized protein LOC142582850 [Dermacentor variabilis]|uniref:uncharacterized protein LOC142582850 n=1 Tax=Dermacentor variabilis TaxID=34621 RepID=UPI003F5C3F29
MIQLKEQVIDTTGQGLRAILGLSLKKAFDRIENAAILDRIAQLGLGERTAGLETNGFRGTHPALQGVRLVQSGSHERLATSMRRAGVSALSREERKLSCAWNQVCGRRARNDDVLATAHDAAKGLLLECVLQQNGAGVCYA